MRGGTSVNLFPTSGGTAVNFHTVLDFANGTKENNSMLVNHSLFEEDDGADTAFGLQGFWILLTDVAAAGPLGYSNYFTVMAEQNTLHVHYTIKEQ